MTGATQIVKTLQNDLWLNKHLLPLRPIDPSKSLHIFVDFSNEKMAFIACQATETKKDNIIDIQSNNLDFFIIDINFKDTPPIKTPNAQRDELMAIKFALDKTEPIILPNNTTLYTDNINILTSAKINKQQVNMQFDIISIINKYNIHIQYFPGKQNIADPISRLLIWARQVCGLPKRNSLNDTQKVKTKQLKTEHTHTHSPLTLPQSVLNQVKLEPMIDTHANTPFRADP